jgi:GntR family transcriptional regulator, transcriptional repressor for pyruvate dehydrogenase complex
MILNFELEPLKIKKLSSMVEDSIKALIIKAQLKTGDKLPTEKEFSTKFGVSLITVREALRGLEALGVIEKKRGKDGGIFIRSNNDSIRDAMLSFFTSQQLSIKDINEVRKLLQPFCARLAASRINEDLMEALEQNIKYCENKLNQSKDKFTEKDYHEIEKRNGEFHRLIGAATCNPILALTVDYVEDFVVSYKRVPDIRESSEKISRHRQILESLKTGNPDKAEKAMMDHITSMGEYFLQKEKYRSAKHSLTQI